MISSIKIMGFRAIDYPQIVQNICHEHKKRLAEFNITALNSANDSWLTNPQVYCFCAVDEEYKRILGSIRIQIAAPLSRLPMEEALSQFNVNIKDQLNELMLNETVAESCGLWCVGGSLAKRINLPAKLLCFQKLICKYLKIQHCFAFVPNHSLLTVCNSGFRKHKEFPSSFSYPDKKYQTWVLYKSPLALKEDNEEIKLRILLNDPHLVYRCEFDGHVVIIKYELLNFDFTAAPSFSKNLCVWF